MNHLEQQAREHAQRTSCPCWLVTPYDGRPFIAYSTAAIPPRYLQAIPVLPTTLTPSLR